MKDNKRYKAIVIGVSAGGFKVIPTLLSSLPKNFFLPIIIVQHRQGDRGTDFLVKNLNEKSFLKVREARQLEKVKKGHVYLAPAGYHLLIDDQKVFSLSMDQKECYARPSIDVFFESAVQVYGDGLIGIILTGANNDGTLGMICIKQNGGITIVQDPKTAEAMEMPQSAIDAGVVDYVLSIKEMGKFLIKKDLESQ